MANPQTENGHTRIANELMQAIYGAKFNGTQRSIIDVVMRYTYGFSRKSHAISVSFLVEATGYDRRQISRELKNLIAMKVIIETKAPTYSQSRELMLNKNYSEWERKSLPIFTPTPISTPSSNSPTDVQSTTTTDGEFTTTTDGNFTPQDKQNIKQNIKQDVQMCFDKLWGLYPSKKGKGKVSAKCKRDIAKLGYDVMAQCIRRYIDDKPDWQQYQNGSTFFSSGYLDYLDGDYSHDSSEIELPIITMASIEKENTATGFRTAEELKNISLEELFS